MLIFKGRAMKNYQYIIITILLTFIVGCKVTDEESVLGTTANESYQEDNALRLSSNNKFVKYRPVNRRLIHRIHRRR